MPMSATLKHFLSHLSVAERVPLPASEEWKEHVERISVPGRIAEVTEEHTERRSSVQLDRRKHRCLCGGMLTVTSADADTAVIECAAYSGCCLVAAAFAEEHFVAAEPGTHPELTKGTTP